VRFCFYKTQFKQTLTSCGAIEVIVSVRSSMHSGSLVKGFGALRATKASMCPFVKVEGETATSHGETSGRTFVRGGASKFKQTCRPERVTTTNGKPTRISWKTHSLFHVSSLK